MITTKEYASAAIAEGAFYSDHILLAQERLDERLKQRTPTFGAFIGNIIEVSVAEVRYGASLANAVLHGVRPEQLR